MPGKELPVPVFQPTVEEFCNFSQYVQKIEKSCAEVGLCKVIPPTGWWRPSSSYEEMHIPNPILQCVSGRVGVFSLDLIERKAMSAKEFKQYAEAYKRKADEKLGSVRHQGEREEAVPDDVKYIEQERVFWRSLSSNMDPPLYGADVPGTMFGDDSASSWNLNKLDSVLNILGHRIPGITSSMLYFGMWKSMFGIHKEDVDLHSINYVHLGEPKIWYAVPPAFASRLELMAQGHFQDKFQQCHEFLRHKTTMLSPMRLSKSGIDYVKAIQRPGEFMITFPGAYHFGFNAGFNIAEAVNFATERWIPIGEAAKVCTCRPDSVRIDMDLFLRLYRSSKKHLTSSLRKKNQKRKLPSPSSGRKSKSRWVFRCSCGVECTSEDPDPAAEEDPSFECSECNIWAHIDCEHPEYEPLEAEELPNEILCLACYQNSGKSLITSTISNNKRSSKMNIGSTLYVNVIPGSSVWEEGIVTDFADGHVRVHFKGCKKDDDEWFEVGSEQLSKMRPRDPPSKRVKKEDSNAQRQRQERRQRAKDQISSLSPDRSSKSILRKKKGLPVKTLRDSMRRDMPVNKGDSSSGSNIAVKQKRCGQCAGCKLADCGTCIYCLDKIKFGGPGKRKRGCIERKCEAMVQLS